MGTIQSKYLLLQNITLVIVLAWFLGIRDWVNSALDGHYSYTLQLSLYDWIVLLLFGVLFVYLIISRELFTSKLEESEKRFRSVFDKSRDGVMLTNPNGEIIHVNNAGCEILGMEEKEICELGRQGLVVKDDKLENALKIREETGNFSGELTFLHKSGKHIPVDLTSSVFSINDGREKRTSLIFRDITEQKEVQNALTVALDEKTFLLEEVHHRIKNNLSIVAGLLELQILNNPDLKEILLGSQSRIQSIAQVHELLYKTESFNSLNVSVYIEKLVDKVIQSLHCEDDKVEIQLDIDSFEMNINQSVPFGLMINELITNSFKHAFDKTDDAMIQISLNKDESGIYFTYKDNGKGIAGLTKTKDIKSYQSLGLKLIKVLAKQLSATNIKIDGDNGFEYQFSFPLKNQSNGQLIKGL